MFTTSLVTVILVLLALGTPQNVPLGADCKIKNSIDGVCLIVTSCTTAIKLLMSNDIESLRGMTCGFEGVNIKVCCPNTNSSDDLIIFKNNTEVATSKPKPVTVKYKSTPRTTTTTTTTTITTMTISTSITTPLVEEVMTTDYSSTPLLSLDNTTPIKSHMDNEKQTKQHINSIPLLSPQADPPPPSPTVEPLNILPNRNTCGLIVGSDKIFGGTIAKIDEFPWLVRIKYKLNNTESYYCLGSLITDRYVLTAGHCIAAPTLEIIDVRLGEWDEESLVDCYDGDCNEPPVDLKIDKKILHPEYNRRIYKHDIALLRLERPVNFTDFIQPVCLPTTDYIARQDYTPDSTYETAGWGLTEFEKTSPIKRKVVLNAVPIDICRVAQPLLPEENIPYTICAGGRQGFDSCRGDSGGSLVKRVAENYRTNWFLYGITSYGPSKCGSAGIPGVYTRIVPHMSWIIENISQ